MKTVNMGQSGLLGSNIIMGCMRIDSLNTKELEQLVYTALDAGINLFDHADIYGGGVCEELFGSFLRANPHLRKDLLLQSKCGIRDGYYDLSKEHIVRSVNESLQRLNTDYLDLFILHRPDTLMEPQEVAEALDTVITAGKVTHVGVSNMNSAQIELLLKYMKHPLIVNQLQLSPTNAGIFTTGIQANTAFDGAPDRHGHILEYSRLTEMTIQAWSPLQFGFFDGVYIDNPDFAELNTVLVRLAEENRVTTSAIALAWILSHPAQMQAVVGTTRVDRLRELCAASSLSLSRQEWYEIYRAAGHPLP
ncbi:aldo/keto reductase [Chitinivibrio alkaliphilus]|uniref:Putative oxidoreductase n=1 Tax=Chitinivibrio alkaliphilus ACht1 TaxID=1313304 RepID=U7DCV3_9BACT|nr:aldo/keto reductase [Chitinivibrio alkaliphilus]ERP39398.1 putative oxidoreductase [Chitinivibrio alkaliphilus ACht1]